MRVNPAVLRWVMDSEGWEADELAGAAGLSAERMRAWMAEESHISMRDLKRMAARFRRPMSVLLMAEAPATAVPPYRRGGGPAAGARLSRAALDVVRRARFVQDNAAELLGAAGGSAEPSVRGAALGQSPESAAAESAADLGIEPPRRAGRGAGRDRRRYSEIREKIESKNVLAMQEIIPGDVEGLALADARPAVILVNWRHPPRRRIFAILHEYAHVLLGDSSACPAAGGGARGAPRVERWCDRFAGAALMPRDGFCAALREAHGEAGGDPLRASADLADRFCVSRAAAAARAARILGGAGGGAAYSRCCGAPGGEAEAGGAAAGRGGGGPARMGQAARCVAQKGRRYARLVADASDSGAITTSTALDYLEIKLKSLDRLGMLCGGG